MATFISHSEEETINFAAEYAKTLRPGDVVLLNGEMGAGKTAFAKGVAKGLGILEEVTSPTYAYVNSYRDFLFHFDCYRVASVAFAEALGFSDYFNENSICLIEWSENIAPLLPPDCKVVTFSGRGETREITY